MTELTFKAVEETATETPKPTPTPTPMASVLPTRWMKHAVDHFDNACDKHPHFVDGASFIDNIYAADLLRVIREGMEKRTKLHFVTIQSVAECELAEVEEALTRGDYDAAIDECYDVIAVMLRAISYIEAKKRGAGK